MSKAVFRRRGGSLIPVDQEGLDLLASIRDGRDVALKIEARRNPNHHRLFFAILKFCTEHAIDRETGEVRFVSIEQAKTAIKIATGEVDPHIDAESGKTFFMVRSISYAAMDQTRFSAFFDRAIYVIAHRWMPEGTTEESVRAEILAMVDPQRSVAA